MKIEKAELIEWLRGQLKKAEASVKARDQAGQTWREGSDESWCLVGCKMSKRQRLQEAARQERISIRCRRDVQMLEMAIEEMRKGI